MSKRKKTNEVMNMSLEQKILNEESVDELQNLIDLFNLNLKKKDIVRSAKLSEMQDKIVDQMSERIEKRPGEFSNTDLLNYHKAVQESLTKSNNTLDDVKLPNIQINQQLNINNADTDSFDRDSRRHIIETVDEILQEMTNQSKGEDFNE